MIETHEEEIEYTYTEADLKKRMQQMVNNGCLPPMHLGTWGIYDDGGIGHYYLVLHDYEKEGLVHSHILLGENVDAAYIALNAIDKLYVKSFSESKEGVARQTHIHNLLMADTPCSVCGDVAVHFYKNGEVELCDKHFKQRYVA